MIMNTAHREIHFENYIVDRLATSGWLVGNTLQYDTEHACTRMTSSPGRKPRSQRSGENFAMLTANAPRDADACCGERLEGNGGN